MQCLAETLIQSVWRKWKGKDEVTENTVSNSWSNKGNYEIYSNLSHNGSGWLEGKQLGLDGP